MRAAAWLCCLAILAFPDAARAETEPPPARPGFRTLRFEEDWSVLAEREALPSRDLFDPLKYIPLRDDGSSWLSLGGQLRGRMEGWSGFLFGDPPGGAQPNAAFLLGRILFHADLHLHPGLRIFAQARSALSTNPPVFGGLRIVDNNEIDLQNGFLELSGEPWELPLTLRLGRQELLFGRQRLVSPLDWSNSRRTFDLASLELDLPGWRVTAFGGVPVRIRPFDFDDHCPGDGICPLAFGTAFYGLHAAGSLPDCGLDLDLYVYGRHRDAVVDLEGSSGDERRATVGARLGGPIGASGFDFDLEADWQGGSIGGEGIHAFAVATELGWWLSRSRLSPRLQLGFDYASGDRSPGELGLFDQLFPLGHAYLGYIDLVARQNVIATSGRLTLRPFPRTVLELTAYGFWRAETGSGLYAANGVEIRAGDAGASREVGAELDVLVKHWIGPHLLVAAGYSRFFPGAFVAETGASASVDFGYLIFQYTF